MGYFIYYAHPTEGKSREGRVIIGNFWGDNPVRFFNLSSLFPSFSKGGICWLFDLPYPKGVNS